MLKNWCWILILLMVSTLPASSKTSEIIFSDDFSSDKGWVFSDHTGWKRGNTESFYCSEFVDFTTDPLNSMLGICPGIYNSYEIISPKIDCKMYGNCRLRIKSTDNLLKPGPSSIKVFDGTQWRTGNLFQLRKIDGWTFCDIDLMDIADKCDEVRIKLIADSTELEFEGGWFVDNVEITGQFFDKIQWLHERLISNEDRMMIRLTAFHLDATSNPHFCVCQNNRLDYLFKTADGWQSQIIDTGDELEFFKADMVLESKETPHIAYIGSCMQEPSLSRLSYAYIKDDDWQHEEIVSDALWGDPLITITSQGNPAILYVVISNNTKSEVFISQKIAFNKWETQKVDIGGYDIYPIIRSFCLDLSNHAHITYSYSTTGKAAVYSTEYVWFDTDKWQHRLLTDDVVPAPMVIHPVGYPVIGYENTVLFLDPSGERIKEILNADYSFIFVRDICIHGNQLHVMYGGAERKYEYQTAVHWESIGSVIKESVCQRYIGFDDQSNLSVSLDNRPYFADNTTYSRRNGSVTYEFQMDNNDLRPGDRFRLTRSMELNTNFLLMGDEYIILDVMGITYFWPSWSKTIDSKSVYLNPWDKKSENTEILAFEWPAGMDLLYGLYFYGGIIECGTDNIVGFDIMEWFCGK